MIGPALALIASLTLASSAHAQAPIAPARAADRVRSRSIDSIVAPLRLHVPASTPDDRAARWLSDLEWAAARATELGWPNPPPDGSRGGSPAFDVYVVPSAAASSIAIADVPVPTVDLPASISHGVVAGSAAETDFASCAISAYVQAATLTLDPNEDIAWRRATGTFVAGIATGVLGGCTTGLTDVQADPSRAWFAPDDDAPDRQDGGALTLLAMSTRHDGGTGRFIRDLWELAALRTDHADPTSGFTLFQVWSEAARGAGDTLRDNLVEDAIERAILDQAWRPRVHPMGITLATPAPAALPPPTRWPNLPARLAGPPNGVEPSASWFYLLDTDGADASARLRIWFQGETGMEWSVTAMAFDSVGHETIRMQMPIRRDPRGYLVIEQVGRHERVLFVVTALPLGIPVVRADAEIDARGAEITLDR